MTVYPAYERKRFYVESPIETLIKLKKLTPIVVNSHGEILGKIIERIVSEIEKHFSLFPYDSEGIIEEKIEQELCRVEKRGINVTSKIETEIRSGYLQGEFMRRKDFSNFFSEFKCPDFLKCYPSEKYSTVLGRDVRYLDFLESHTRFSGDSHIGYQNYAYVGTMNFCEVSKAFSVCIKTDNGTYSSDYFLRLLKKSGVLEVVSIDDTECHLKPILVSA